MGLFKLCKTLDTDNSGELSLDELKGGFETNQAFSDVLQVMDVKKEDMELIFGILDEDHSGNVTYREFVEQLYKMKSQDMQTMLVFIRGYIAELRQMLLSQKDMLGTNVRKTLDISDVLNASLGSTLEIPRVCDNPEAVFTSNGEVARKDVFRVPDLATELRRLRERVDQDLVKMMQELTKKVDEQCRAQSRLCEVFAHQLDNASLGASPSK